ncbi:beta strand repeat-containing protein [Clostridium hydrogenum]|uniref:beta strand repeat-containing protein n=1 Tax=Clostridium hydrogenum TaxID=2855764 RepID=UPI001F210800|nr:hypothetical protein [Clostridium hydrogenum]
MANNKKIVSVLSTAALAGLITTALGTTAFAKTTDVVVKSGTNDYSYNLQSLTGAFDDYQMDSTKGALYQNYLTNLKNGSIEALKDDVTGYIDFSKVQAAFENAQLVGTAFDLNAYTSTSKDVITPSNPVSDVAVGSDGQVTVTPEGLSVKSVTATSATTLKVTFSKPVSGLQPINFVVKDANGNQEYVNTVTSETTDPTSVDVVLYDALTDGATYTVTAQNITAADGTTLTTKDTSVTYAKAKPAAIKFKTTTIPSGTVDLKNYITITDANGNDITPDYLNDVTFTASTALVDGVSKVSLANGGFVFVTASITDNASIATQQVKLSVANSVATTVNTFNLTDGTATDNGVATLYLNGTMFDSKSNELYGQATLQAAFKDQYGNDFVSGNAVNPTPTGTTFTSLNPSVVTVDQVTGVVTPVAAGTAYVNVTNGTASKTIPVVVKADPVATTITPDTTAVSVSNGFDKVVNLTFKDQYGNAITGGTLTATSADSKVATVTNTSNSVDITGVAAGTTTVTVNYTTTDSFTGAQTTATLTIPVTAVKPSAVAGYKIVTLDDGKIDLNAAAKNTDAEYKVYTVDASGNYVADVTPTTTFTTESTGSTAGIYLDQNNGTFTVDTTKSTKNTTGTDIVTVKEGSLTIGTVNVSLVNTTVVNPVVSISANATAVEVPANLDVKAAVYAKLSAKYKDGTVATASDFTNVVMPSEVMYVYSSNHSVLDDNNYTVKGVGTTTLTYRFTDPTIAPISIQVNVGNLAVQGIAQNILGTNNGLVVANGTTLTTTLSATGKSVLLSNVLNKANILANISNYAAPSNITVTFSGNTYTLTKAADATALKTALSVALNKPYSAITLGDLANAGVTATVSFGVPAGYTPVTYTLAIQ